MCEQQVLAGLLSFALAAPGAGRRYHVSTIEGLPCALTPMAVARGLNDLAAVEPGIPGDLSEGPG